MYLFNVAYSPGEGPVPFVSFVLALISPKKTVSDDIIQVYSAESMPLYIRDLGKIYCFLAF